MQDYLETNIASEIIEKGTNMGHKNSNDPRHIPDAFDPKTITNATRIKTTETVAKAQSITASGWTHYSNENNYNDNLKTISNCGKWMYFYEKPDLDFVIKMAKLAITSKTVTICKHTAINASAPTGVLCFYIDGSNNEDHIKVLKFMMENDMIPKNLNGNFKNISFKFDSQTQNNEYGSAFNAKINLATFMDVANGRFYR